MRFFSSPLFLLFIFALVLSLGDSVFDKKAQRNDVFGLPPIEQNELKKVFQNEIYQNTKGKDIAPLSQSQR
jgi:hypothetical protein